MLAASSLMRGGAADRAATAIPFFGRSLRSTKGCVAGTHRTRTPAETLEEYERHVPAMGITRLADITGFDRLGLSVFTAVRPNAVSLTTSQGKGLDRTAAKASALMEAAERWHAEVLAPPLRLGTSPELRRYGRPVDLGTLPTVSGRRAVDRRQLWVEGYDITADEAVWVPLECVALVRPSYPYGPQFPLDSTGLAAGNHVLEAVLHALYEAIERDATVLWGGRFARRPSELDERSIELDGVSDPGVRALLGRLRAADVRVTGWDLTTDVGVPVYRCAIAEAGDGPAELPPFSGEGCHLSPLVALQRALTEAAQIRAVYLSGVRETQGPASGGPATPPSGKRAATAPARALTAVDASTPTFEGDVHAVLRRFEGAGIATRVVVVDLTAAHIGIPVVKVVVPGLEHPSAARRMRALRFGVAR